MEQLVNVPQLVASILGFIVLFWGLKYLFWKPVLATIDERRKTIARSFEDIEVKLREVDAMRNDYETKLRGIEAEATVKIQEAVREGQALAAEVRKEAEATRQRMIEKARDEITRSYDEALAEIRNTAVELSFTITEKVLKRSLDHAAHVDLVNSFIDEVKEI